MGRIMEAQQLATREYQIGLIDGYNDFAVSLSIPGRPLTREQLEEALPKLRRMKTHANWAESQHDDYIAGYRAGFNFRRD